MPDKKIYFTVTNDLNYDQRMIRICSSLTNAGFNVHLVGRKKRNSATLITRNFTQTRLFCWFEKGKFFYLEYNLRLFFFLLFKNWDAVCAIDLDTILPAYYSSRIKRKKVIYDAHEYFTEVPELINRPKTKAIWEWVAKRTVPNIKYCYTVGESLAKVLEKRYKVNFKVIRNLPFRKETPQKKLSILPSDEITILYQGVLNEGRGLEAAIQAMHHLPQHFHLRLAGEGDLSDFLQQMVAKEGLKDRVEFLGFVLPDQLPTITKEAHLGLNLLENKSLNYYYSLANKCLDYIQAGLPSLNMNFPEYRRIHELYSCVLLVDQLNPESIAQEILSVIENQDTYFTLHKACQLAADELSWEKEQIKLIPFYQEVFS